MECLSYLGQPIYNQRSYFLVLGWYFYLMLWLLCWSCLTLRIRRSKNIRGVQFVKICMSFQSSYCQWSGLWEISPTLVAIHQMSVTNKSQCVALVWIELVVLLELRTAVAALVNWCFVNNLNDNIAGRIHLILPTRVRHRESWLGRYFQAFLSLKGVHHYFLGVRFLDLHSLESPCSILAWLTMWNWLLVVAVIGQIILAEILLVVKGGKVPLRPRPIWC